MNKIVLIRGITSSPPVFDRSANGDDGDDSDGYDDGVVTVPLALPFDVVVVVVVFVILSTPRQAAPTSYRLSFLLVPPFCCALVRSQIHYGL